MKYSLDQVVEKLQLLVNRMREHENAVDEVTHEVLKLDEQMMHKEVCQELSLSITDFSKRLTNHPRGQLILCLAAENQELEQLQSENLTLFDSLNEHRVALDIVMSKYRKQVSKLMRTNQIEDLIRSNYSSLNSQKNPLGTVSNALQTNKSTGLDSTISAASGTAQPVSGSAQTTAAKPGNSAIRNLMPEASAPNSRMVNEQLAALAALAMDISDQGDAYATELEEELHRLRSENAGLREMLGISSTYSNEVGAVARSEDGAANKSSSTEPVAAQRTGTLPGPPNRLPNSNSDNWPFENPVDRSAGMSHFLNALKAHSFFPEEFVSSPEEEEDEEDALTVEENSEELEVDIGRDTHMPNRTPE
ncbi:unnamed protein product [Echinostoma caproni]|uniref:GAT domain-containing protein n=1 Tax=Echinostoma caproni TaxID=27848 RepID=A0A183AHJ2_9TREM|nr:unnamed protein product [Echinostoma caproni]